MFDILYFVVGIKAHESLCYLLMYLNLTLKKKKIIFAQSKNNFKIPFFVKLIYEKETS
jgi:hypothetical protein